MLVVFVDEARERIDEGGVNIDPLVVFTEPYKKLPIFTFDISYLVDSC